MHRVFGSCGVAGVLEKVREGNGCGVGLMPLAAEQRDCSFTYSSSRRSIVRSSNTYISIYISTKSDAGDMMQA